MHSYWRKLRMKMIENSYPHFLEVKDVNKGVLRSSKQSADY